MKKAIAFLAILALVNLTQAANFTWNSAATGVDYLGNTLTAGNAYGVFIWSTDGSSIFNGGTPVTANRLPLDTKDLVLDATGNVAANGRINSTTRTTPTWGGATYTMATPPTGVNATPTFFPVGSGQQLDFYMIVYDNADMSKATHFQILSKLDVAGPGTATTAMTVQFGTLTKAGWLPVPEPATMALFGVGLAVLGLRRRFMKK